MRFLTEPQKHLVEIIECYIKTHSTEERSFLKQCYEETYTNVKDPQFIAGHIQGNFLSMISRMIRPKQILEIGTFTGYSAVCFADGLTEDGIVHTIDNNSLIYDIAEKYIALSENPNKIKFYKGNAFDVIPTINETFDLVYIDADKVESSDYYDLIFNKVRKGGFIVCDNALWYGKVLSIEQDDDTKGLHLLNEKIQNDHRVFNVLVSVRDGIMLAQKII